MLTRRSPVSAFIGRLLALRHFHRVNCVMVGKIATNLFSHLAPQDRSVPDGPTPPYRQKMMNDINSYNCTPLRPEQPTEHHARDIFKNIRHGRGCRLRKKAGEVYAVARRHWPVSMPFTRAGNMGFSGAALRNEPTTRLTPLCLLRQKIARLPGAQYQYSDPQCESHDSPQTVEISTPGIRFRGQPQRVKFLLLPRDRGCGVS